MAVSGSKLRRRRLSRELVTRPDRRESDAPALQTGTGCSVDWARAEERPRCDPLAVMQHTLLIQIFRSGHGKTRIGIVIFLAKQLFIKILRGMNTSFKCLVQLRPNQNQII